jgi:hypothetical protein
MINRIPAGAHVATAAKAAASGLEAGRDAAAQAA